MIKQTNYEEKIEKLVQAFKDLRYKWAAQLMNLVRKENLSLSTSYYKAEDLVKSLQLLWTSVMLAEHKNYVRFQEGRDFADKLFIAVTNENDRDHCDDLMLLLLKDYEKKTKISFFSLKVTEFLIGENNTSEALTIVMSSSILEALYIMMIKTAVATAFDDYDTANQIVSEIKQKITPSVASLLVADKINDNDLGNDTGAEIENNKSNISPMNVIGLTFGCGWQIFWIVVLIVGLVTIFKSCVN